MNAKEKRKEQLLKELEEIRQRMAELNRSAVHDKLAEEELIKSEERYRSLVELSPDMIALHSRGRYVYVNPAGIRLLGASGPADLIGKSTFDNIHPSCLEIVQERYQQLEQGEEVPLVEEKYLRLDGTIVDVEVAASPIRFQDEPMVQVIARDITRRKRTEEAFRRSEEEAKRLARESAVMAEIGRIMSSTLKIEEVYERFARETQKLIDFDRIAIGIINQKDGTVTHGYGWGNGTSGRRPQEIYPLECSINEQILRTRKSLMVQTENEKEDANFSILLYAFQAGLRSIMSIPLLSYDQVIGVLHFRSARPNAYTENDLKLAERIADQIAGAIANAQLYKERRWAEEALQKSLSLLQATLDSTADGILVVDRKGKITSFNQKFLALWRISDSLLALRDEDQWLKNVSDQLQGPDIFRNKVKALYAQPEVESFDVLEFKDGRAFERYSKPQKRGEEVIGRVWSFRDVTERKRAEEALRRSEAEAKRLAHESAVMAEIAPILSSTLNIEEVYELFSEKVKGILPFDWVAISLIDKEKNAFINRYVEGNPLPGRNQGEFFSISGTFSEKILQSRKGIMIGDKTEDEIVAEFPSLLVSIKAGFKSFLSVPLISRDQVFGILHFRSKKDRVYSEQDLKLAESIAHQIAGAIANATLYRELKEAKETLQEKEKEFRELYDHAPLGYHEFDRDGRITRVNKTDLEMLGYGVEEMIGQPMWKFNVGEELVKEQILARLAGRLPPAKNLVRIYRRKDGSTFPVLIEDRLLKDERGEIIGIRAAVQDITERKRAEEALRKSEEEARRLAGETEVLAEMGRIISSTLNIEEVYGLFTEKVRKVLLFDIMSINTVDRDKNIVTQAYVTGPPVPGRGAKDSFPLAGSFTEEGIRSKEGRIYHPRSEDEVAERLPGLLPSFRSGMRSMMVVPLVSKDQTIGTLQFAATQPNAYTREALELALRVGNQVAGAIANARLFDELRQTQETLWKSEEKYRLLVQNSTDAIFIVQDGRIKFGNLKAEELLGYSVLELLRIPFADHIHPDDRDMVVDRHKRRLAGENPPSAYSFRVRNKLGNELWVELNAVSIVWEERPATLNFARDITEQKRLETQFLQAQKMEAVGRLAGGVAHDFNNLLTIINTNAQLSLLDLKDWDPLKGKLESIQKAGERAANLTRQLLAFSRRQVVDMKVIDLNTLLQELGKMLTRIIGEDIQLSTILDKALGRVKVDPGQIEQVILNLVVNAKDAMPSGGKLTIETANVELDREYAHTHFVVKPGRYVMLSVSDTGVGMSPEVRERVFEPFFTTKEKGKGTGLGLSTVYGVVKQSGGYIWVYSEPGQGTTFKIYLPQVDEPLEEEIRKQVVKGTLPGGTETILVVEDEEEVRKLAVAILRKQGYRILEASNGGDAFLTCEQGKEPVHLLLTDVVMPGLNGPELARRLKYFHPEMKALFMSGYTDNTIFQQDILDHGMFFLQKPFSVEGLVGKVREALDR